MYSKTEFKKIERNYLKERKRLERIKPGQLIWNEAPRAGDMDYHPAIVKKVNVDGAYVTAIDVSDEGHPERKYYSFLTESELMKEGFSRKDIREEYKKHKKTIDSILSKK